MRLVEMIRESDGQVFRDVKVTETERTFAEAKYGVIQCVIVLDTPLSPNTHILQKRLKIYRAYNSNCGPINQ